MALIPAFGLIALFTLLAYSPAHAVITPFQLPDSNNAQYQSHARNSIPSVDLQPPYRLPTSIIPSKYTLTIQPILKPHPSFEQYTIPGYVNIDVECKQVTKTITLHARDIEFQNIRVQDSFGRGLALNGSEAGNVNDFYHIYLENDLVVGQMYSLKLEFISKLSKTDLYGMYVSTYVDEETGDIRELATTTMHANHARRLFPCFDEPHLKAVFQTAVGTSIDMKCLTNSELAFSINLGAYRFHYFRPTPPMSTYLLAVVISDFTEVSASLAEFPKPIRVWGPPSYMNASGGDYAVKIIPKIMTYFQEFTNFTYDFPKLDSVAVPQFAFGAMENWGLITYRLERLMHIPGENTEADRKRVAQIIAHEVAHQWHGNVITYNWWSEAWLTEGFASFLEFRGMGAAAPEFNGEEAIISDSIQDAMIFDQGPNTHPISQAEVTPDQASAFFDTIAYEKGASLLRMLESVLTREKFDNGVRRFIRDNAYGSVVFSDLWNALQTEGGDQLEGGLTVAEFMRQWTVLPGYPLVRATVAGPGRILVSQEKFTLNSGTVPTEDSRSVSSWHIPISAVTADNPAIDRSPAFWIYATQSLTSYDVDTTNWVILNPEAAGYFRVLYDNQLLGHIKHQLETNHTAFTPGTRSQLLEDYFQLAKAGYVPMETALDLTSYLGKETELVVWTPVLAHLKDIIRRLADDPTSLEAFKNYFLPKISQLLLNDDFKNTTGVDMILGAQLFDLAVVLGDMERTEWAQNIFREWVQNVTNRGIIKPVDLRQTVYCAGIQVADQQTWNTIHIVYETEKYSWTKAQLLKALSCSANPDVLTNYIQLANNGTGFCLEDTLAAVAENSVGRPIVYDFIKKLVEEDPSEKTGMIFANAMTALEKYIHQQSYLEEIQDFVNFHKQAFPSALPSINSSINKIRDNIRWWSQVGQNVVSWFRTRAP